MPTHNSYFPVRTGDQIIWLHNFRNKILSYKDVLTHSFTEINRMHADVDRAVYLLDTVNDSTRQFAQAITTATRTALYGTGTTAPVLPAFALPTTPTPPVSVLPGALKRLFASIKNIKTRPGYTQAIGEDLGIIGEETTDDATATPPVKAEARSGEVLLTFKKRGHLAVWIESQIAAETEWSHIAIDTSSPYHDTRPLKVANQPEKRRYRLCYWDGDPTHNWSDIIEVTYGG